jgi:DNA-binding protein HU-beta
VNKGQLVDALESRLGGKKAAAEALEAVVDVITMSVAKGEKVAITGFGTFEKAARAARTGRNPRTGQAVRIRKTSVPRFRAGTAFKQVTSDAKALRAFKSEVAARAAQASARLAGSAVGTVQRAVAKKAPAKKAAVKKAVATKAPAKKAAVKKAVATKAPAKKVAKKAAPVKKAVVKRTAPPRKAVAKKVPAKKVARKRA